jgi:anti-anti-sigma regulatory factor
MSDLGEVSLPLTRRQPGEPAGGRRLDNRNDSRGGISVGTCIDFVTGMEMGKKKIFATMEHHDWVTLVRFELDRLVETRDLVELKETLQQAVEEDSGRCLLLDCSQVQAVSTAALAVLLKYQRQLYDNGRRLNLYGLAGGKITPAGNDTYTHEIFKVFDLEVFFDVTGESSMTLEQCLARINGRATMHHSDSTSAHQPISC